MLRGRSLIVASVTVETKGAVGVDFADQRVDGSSDSDAIGC